MSFFKILEKKLEEQAEERNLTDFIYLTKHLHVYPDFHGNRSPLADPNMSGQICGLSFDTGITGVAILYLATIQALAYQSRHILERLGDSGVRPKMITIIGGLAQNRLYSQTLCDVCSLPVLVPSSPETAMILGSAILGSSNTDEFRDTSFRELVEQFGQTTSFKSTTTISASNDSTTAASTVLLTPNASTAKFHLNKYQVFKLMIDDQIKYRNLMEQ